MIKQKQQLIEDAKKVGYAVETKPGSLVVMIRRHRRTGRVIRGILLYDDGTAIDVTVDLSVAKGIRSYRDMRAVLGLSER